MLLHVVTGLLAVLATAGVNGQQPQQVPYQQPHMHQEPQQVHQQQPPPQMQQQQQQQPPPQVHQQQPPPQMQQQQQPPPQMQQQQPPPGMQQQQPPPQMHQQQQPPPQMHQQQPPLGMHQQQPPPGMHQQQPPPGMHQQQPPPGMHQQQPPPGMHQQQQPMHPQVHYEVPPAVNSNQPWYETLPAVAMDYKVHIDPGKEDCYFQYVNPGATFYVSFQVLRGGDGKAGFAVRNPSGEIVHPYQWRDNADYQDLSQHGGYYSVCVDNQFSRFAGKLVNLYITVIRYDQWEKFAKELEDMNLSVENVTNTLVGVEKNIYEVMQIQHFSRSREDRDYNLLVDNNAYVQNWSILQVIVIVATTVLQVYFVRRLFEVKSSGYSRSRI